MEKEKKELMAKNEEKEAPEMKEKKGLAKIAETVRRKYDAVRYSKWGKVAAKILTAAGFAATAKLAYDKGVKSVKPTTIYVQPIPEEPESTEEPATDPAEEEAPVETETIAE